MKSEHYDNRLLAEMRRDSGLSQPQAATKAGVSRITVARAELGLGVSYDALIKLTKAYEKPISSILHDSPPVTA